jgi:hypothetical protein
MIATTIGILVSLAHTRNDNNERRRGEGGEEERAEGRGQRTEQQLRALLEDQQEI